MIRPAAPDAVFHWVMLGTAAAVVGMACILRVEGVDRVVLPLVDQPLPGICTYQRWFGVSCPGCGLTRSFVSLAHADLRSAWRFNPAGIWLFALVMAQFPYRSLQLWRNRRGLPELQLGWWTQLLFWSTLVALLGQWLMRGWFAFSA